MPSTAITDHRIDCPVPSLPGFARIWHSLAGLRLCFVGWARGGGGLSIGGEIMRSKALLIRSAGRFVVHGFMIRPVSRVFGGRRRELNFAGTVYWALSRTYTRAAPPCGAAFSLDRSTAPPCGSGMTGVVRHRRLKFHRFGRDMTGYC